METIKVNLNSLKSITKSERQKSFLENKGYNLISEECFGNTYIIKNNN